jgi:uncharacterized protein YndB with AHSA1/START domain
VGASASHSVAEISLPSDREIVITRSFAAPSHAVFDAWSTSEWIRRWYGCGSQSMTVCDVDFRVGGRWHWVLRDRDSGTEHSFRGEYREIERPSLLAFTEIYEAFPDSDHVVELRFVERSGRTTMTMRIVHATPADRDAHLRAGMETGVQQMLDRLAAELDGEASG